MALPHIQGLGLILTHVWFFAGAFIFIVQKDPHSKLHGMRNMIAISEKPVAQGVEGTLTFGHSYCQNPTQNQEFQVQILSSSHKLGNQNSILLQDAGYSLRMCFAFCFVLFLIELVQPLNIRSFPRKIGISDFFGKIKAQIHPHAGNRGAGLSGHCSSLPWG